MLVLILAAGMFTYVRTRPRVSDDEIGDALAEVERVRASLDDVECRRPPLFGAATDEALPLDEFLSLGGPFAECWRAVLVAPGPDPLDYPGGFRFYPDRNLAQLFASYPQESLLASCAELPGEVRLQARTPDRCTPYSPSSEEWSAQIDAPYEEASKMYFAHAVALMAQHGEMSQDDRFRLYVQGMAVGRDLSQGPADFRNASYGYEVESRLAAGFVRQLEEAAPNPELRGELHDALQVLADGPINVYASLAAQGLWYVERGQPELYDEEEARHLDLFTRVSLLSRFVESCPPGASVDACVEHFPYARPSHPSDYEYMLGPRFVRDWSVGYEHHSMTSGFDELTFDSDLRANAQALQALLRWSTDKAAGTCPEVSSWAYDEDDPRAYIDRDNSRTNYRWITPGPVRSALYFDCSVPDTSH